MHNPEVVRLVVVFCAGLLLFMACNSSEEPETVYYTVTFDAAGGSPEPEPRKVTNGSSLGSANMPSEPSNGEYLFNGWYTEPEGGGSEFTGTTRVTGDITVYAWWTLKPAPIQYTVTFDGDSPETETRTVSAGGSLGSANMPQDPTKREYVFDGWYTERESGGTEFTATTMVTGNITVYARWRSFDSLSLAEALTWISTNAATEETYTITLKDDETIAPSLLNCLGKTVNITLTGGTTERTVRLRTTGSLFTVENGVTLTLARNITLQGRSDNTASLVRVKTGGILVMQTGSKIRENTSNYSYQGVSSIAGGVYVDSEGTFTLSGGTITGNTCRPYSSGSPHGAKLDPQFSLFMLYFLIHAENSGRGNMAQEKSFDMAEKFAGLDFHAIRLENRFIRTMETLMKQPGTSIWEASENRAEAKAIYRMLGNEDVDRQEIIRTHREATIRRMAEYGDPILAVQDTTGVNYNTHLKTEGIGYISDKTRGVNIHSCIAVTGDGLVLGVLDQSSYNRPEPKDESASHDRKKRRPIEEKESFRWLETMERSTADIPQELPVITVCDREGDMYELFAKAAELDESFLIRIVQNRMTVENKRILDEIRKKRCQGRVGVTIPRDSHSSIPEREAELQMRYAPFTIQRPAILNPVKTLPESVEVNVIYVKEEHPPKGHEAIAWFLMTSEPVNTVEEAYKYVGYYMQRWKIERFH
jgi:uncharacterized repeat protein (TIGR02543 family)